MELPNRHLAYVPEAKITRYLLNESNPRGRGKAILLRRRGYNESNIATLIRELIEIARTQPVTESKNTPFGVNYVIYGLLQPPSGGELLVRTCLRRKYAFSSDGISKAARRGE